MKRLHLGCGDDIREGWDNLDIVKKPGIKFVQDATDLSNIKENTYDEIEASDLIEHISWRDTRKTLSEWIRVLKPGSKLIIKTPSAEELGMIVMSPDNPILRKLDIDATNFDYFSRVAFGHQDHPGNFHKAYFTEDWLKQLCEEAGGKVHVMYGDLFHIEVEVTK